MLEVEFEKNGVNPASSIIKELELKNAKQSQIIEQIQESVISIDVDGYITSWNRGAKRLLGYSAKEVISKHITTIISQEQYDKRVKEIKSSIGKRRYTNDIEIISKSGKSIVVNLSLSFWRDNKKNVLGLIGYIQDRTERKMAEMALYNQAHYDSLTGLPNRLMFNENLKKSVTKAKSNSNRLALFFIDLDHFKEINDSLGHTVGDEVLKVVSARLKSVVGSENAIARLGGDEFTVIIENLTDTQSVSQMAQDIVDSLLNPIAIKENRLYVTCSIGISLYPYDSRYMKNLIKFADTAMYSAKEMGRSGYQYYKSEMTKRALDRVLLETSLRNALKRDEFLVYYQPRYDGRTEKLSGMEALVRWVHPIMGIMSPDSFIPLAESTGVIIEMDRFVMRRAMDDVVKWHEEGLSPGIMAINLSIKQLQHVDFISTLEKLLEETRCRPEWLEFEVTESQIMSNPQESIRILEIINDMGISLSVDDFGTGYSSLAYLKKLPVNKLKIDQSFVKNLPGDEEDAAIIKAIIALAKSLKFQIVAEGVETKEQKDFIVECGCECIQGYYYAKPMPADEIDSILKG